MEGGPIYQDGRVDRSDPGCHCHPCLVCHAGTVIGRLSPASMDSTNTASLRTGSGFVWAALDGAWRGRLRQLFQRLSTAC